MNRKRSNTVLLVGAGEMAIEYTKVLTSMQRDFIVVGRGKQSAQKYKEITGFNIELGGIDKWIEKTEICPEYAIVAVTGNQLGNVAISLLKSGIKNILLEKPGGLNNKIIQSVAELTETYNANVLIAYNRRFYTSVIKAIEIIRESGGVTSFYFEFTEWSHIIENSNKSKDIKNQWLLHNSSHVIDLAFYLGGEPKDMICYTTGSLNWHPNGSIFVGTGISKNNALFSYHSNWDAPGRWSVEVLTNKYRLIFKPLEKLKIQRRESVAIEDVEIDYELDDKFKPGLYRQVDAFLNDKKSNFLNIKQQTSRLAVYDMIVKGKEEKGLETND
jgi:predicted dehydrogenase